MEAKKTNYRPISSSGSSVLVLTSVAADFRSVSWNETFLALNDTKIKYVLLGFSKVDIGDEDRNLLFPGPLSFMCHGSSLSRSHEYKGLGGAMILLGK